MRRHWLQHLALIAAAVGVVVALAAVLGLSGRRDERRLAEAMARLDADDPDWNVVGVVKAHNAAVPADGAANATQAAAAALALRPPSWARRLAATSSGGDIPGVTWDNDRLPRDEEFCSLYEVAVESEGAVRAALAARALPAGGVPFHFGEPEPHAVAFAHRVVVRDLGLLLADWATAEAYLGRGDEALRAADAAAHVAQVTLATEPFFFGQTQRRSVLTAAAFGAQQTLAWTEPSGELARLQATFTAAAATDGFTPALRGERAAMTRVYDNVHAGDLPADYLDQFFKSTAAAGRADRYKRRLGGRSVLRDQAEVLAAYDDLLAAARLTGPERRAACDGVVARVDPGLAPLFAFVDRTVEAEDVVRARLLCAAVGLACERHRRQFGRWPATLAEVPASILPATPPDPLTGEALAYQVLGDGAIVYSVSKVGHVRPGYTDEDVSVLGWELAAKFRLWNPESRRRPPPSEPAPGDAP